ncbi:MaoC family dehydratase [Glutamicibacter halophytocola]|uniref:MaoC family dehydratase n=1 Tax=Glutamicibacter halophytocola TaxID=1933880 RepID=UPI00155939E0|nr:MaoC family dehydratase [Glutamicibacter halophytocola]NQD40496.1 MaoC family dehydratase [Glutamicibacter halophytocola]
MAGMYFEDFVIGEVIRHDVTRTVTETDNLLFTTLTMNVQPLHLDSEFSKDSIYGQRIVNSVFTLGVVTGVPVQETTLGTTLGNLGFRDIQFPKPVFIGDTLRVETKALDTRVSKSRPDTGIVGIEHRGYNQRDELVCVVRRTALMKRRENAPQ